MGKEDGMAIHLKSFWRFSATGRAVAILIAGLAAALAAAITPSQAGTRQPLVQQILPVGFQTSDRWKRHITQELMPFWTNPAALGNPTGNFPSVRCNNGLVINYAQPCQEANNGYLLQQRTTIVALSRQTYGYCMAFHMTGNPLYLRYAAAGARFIRTNALDRINGGSHTYRDNITGKWDDAPDLRTAQELGYALLGLSCYHFITRDPAVYADVLAVKNYIFQNYNNTALGYIQWQLADGNGNKAHDKHLTAQLDQLPYMLLMLPDLPASERSKWKIEVVGIADTMLSKFYNASEKLFFIQANTTADIDLSQTGTDFGHNAKILWNLKIIGRLTGRQDLIDFANTNAPGLLQRAFMTQPGTWANGVFPGGDVDQEKTWWIHAELDQLIGIMSLRNISYTTKSKRSYAYWFKYFVDHKNGEVWNSIEANGNNPTGLFPKAWFWKNAFHSVEHAYYGFVTTAQLEKKPVELYYAFKSPVANSSVHPGPFTGRLKSITSSPNGSKGWIYKATFTNVGF
jgi:mannose/cellobiose epimerase-like protein (N-acyl-D-glucosamine 2-epimerase family)